MKVGRLRVKNSRYFDIDRIKGSAPSLKEGAVPNFTDVTKDIVALNQWPDRRVTPALRAGVTPGTVDVDLNVEDTAPIHANVEINDRQSPNTTATRLNATVHYDDLWQLGHSLSFSYQVAPERPSDAEVFSGSYLAHTDINWLSVLLYGVKSDSNVATVGGTNIVGPGEIVGSRAVITLPSRDNFFHTLSVGARLQAFRPDRFSRGQRLLLAGHLLSAGRKLWRDVSEREVHDTAERLDHLQSATGEQRAGRLRQQAL